MGNLPFDTRLEIISEDFRNSVALNLYKLKTFLIVQLQKNIKIQIYLFDYYGIK